MNSFKIFAPAKVNLFLKVLNKRKDSYHNILTLFNKVSLADEIKITKIPRGIKISSDKFITRLPKENLAYKAAELILRSKKVRDGVKISIKKTVPIAAGLGGGSSDAASVLVGINKLFNLKIKEDELMFLGRKLGADVPFFIANTAFAIGHARGDRIRKINLGVRPWHLIIYPGFGLSSREVYQSFDKHLSRYLTSKRGNAKIYPSLRDSMDFDDLEEMLYNNLEDIVIANKKIIDNIIKRLASSLCKKAILSGSGPSVFCLYRTGKEAIAARRKLLRSVPVCERKDWQVFVTRTVD